MSNEYKLIEDSPVLLLQPVLAKIIGLNEAIALQQIHYWIENNKEKKSEKHFHKGRYWTYNTYKEWLLELPFRSESTVKRTFKSLENMGILITGNFNKKGYDKTKWYTIDYKELNKVIESYKSNQEKSCGQNGQSVCSNWPEGYGQNEQTNTKDLPKTSSKISSYMVQKDESCLHNFDFSIVKKQIEIAYNKLTNNNDSKCTNDLPYESTDYIDIFEYFYCRYYYYTGHDHPRYKNELVKEVMGKLPVVNFDNINVEVSVEDNKTMIDAYFNQPWDDDVDPTIAHFCSGNIRELRFYERLY